MAMLRMALLSSIFVVADVAIRGAALGFSEEQGSVGKTRIDPTDPRLKSCKSPSETASFLKHVGNRMLLLLAPHSLHLLFN